ncbi:MAG: hypothetical protein AB1762_03630 [Gemmatimonadota bacterium]
MPLSHVIDQNLRVVLCRAWGVVRDEELNELFVSLRDDPKFDPHFGQLLDLRSAVLFDVTTVGVMSAARNDPFARTSRRAIVVDSEAAFGIGRVYLLSVDATSAQACIVRDASEALDWLGIAPETVQPGVLGHRA